MNTDKAISATNKLLRGERSAVETYDQAISKFSGENAVTDLSRIRHEHSTAVADLEQAVRSLGGDPDQSSGAWGAFANSVQATANLFGQNSALESLQTGEKAGKSDYENTLEDEDVTPDVKTLIRSRLLPATNSHIAALQRLQDDNK